MARLRRGDRPPARHRCPGPTWRSPAVARLPRIARSRCTPTACDRADRHLPARAGARDGSGDAGLRPARRADQKITVKHGDIPTWYMAR
ncbi:hypothetical protein HBB16_20900 [Pseudonocardia sp. MCCB 268]|nr:hypothetical protein [Pseudonocardia cytotoxica]